MPVFLNHFYFVPDEKTYDAIKRRWCVNHAA
jgi:hypothetical protein